MTQKILIDIDFTEEERHYINLLAMQPETTSAWTRIIFTATFYLPSLLLGLYGIYEASFKTVAIAFLTMVCGIAWAIAGEFRDARYTVLAFSVCRKLRAAMKNSERE